MTTTHRAGQRRIDAGERSYRSMTTGVDDHGVAIRRIGSRASQARQVRRDGTPGHPWALGEDVHAED